MLQKSTEKAQKIRDDLMMMMTLFREVLDEENTNELSLYLPWIGNKLPSDPECFPPKLPHAYSISFELLNMVEENADAQLRRKNEGREDSAPNSGLWDYNLNRLEKDGLTPEEIAATLSGIHVEPVLTAHPTEAKRASVLEHHHDIYVNLVKLENSMFTEAERHIIEENIKTTLEVLWRTGEIAGKKPEVLDELNNIIHYMRDIFPEALKRLDDRLKSSWERHGFERKLLQDPDVFPRITFGNWVGGDRDGHPLVNATITEKTLVILRNTALRMIREALFRLAKKLSISDRLFPVPEYIQKKIMRMEEEISKAGQSAYYKNEGESIRRYINLMIAKIPQDAHAPIRENEPNALHIAYLSHLELISDLRLLRRSLVEMKAYRTSGRNIFQLIRLVKTFGFHLSALDVRQNSLYHEKAFSQILEASGISPREYLDLDDAGKFAYLSRELESPRPYLARNQNAGEEATEILNTFNVLRKYMENFGASGLGNYVVSMTRSAADLLLIYIFAREVGFLIRKGNKVIFPIPVCPLFETVEDLNNAPGILGFFFRNAVTIHSMEYIKDRDNLGQKTQTVMVGYSDSNKDGGILAAAWGLYGAQRAMVDVSESHSVKIRFFHGKGGTISRGAGPTHRFLDALPKGSVKGDIRITEQGETISHKYANYTGATYNLELLAAGVLGASLASKPPEDNKLTEIFNYLSEVSRQTYQKLVTHENFIQFFNEATPIDAIEKAHIGSRPTRRTGRKTIFDLRAIPWVFSWNQSRFYLTGWFGVGSALGSLRETRPEDYQYFKKGIGSWSFGKYIFTNIETSISSADIDVMRDYASMVQDTSIRDFFCASIQKEYLLSREMLNDLFDGEMERRRPGLTSTLRHRAEPLRLLHISQIYLLKEFRKADEAGKTQLLPRLLQSINAIAAGLRTTG